MKIFRRIFNRWGYRGLLPICYSVLVLGLIGVYLLCALPLLIKGKKPGDIFSGPSTACGGMFDFLITLIIIILMLPGVALVFPGLLFLKNTTLEPLLPYLSYLSLPVNIFIAFLIGTFFDQRYKRGR